MLRLRLQPDGMVDALDLRFNNATSSDRLGETLASADAGRLLVGKPGDGTLGGAGGVVFVYRRNGFDFDVLPLSSMFPQPRGEFGLSLAAGVDAGSGEVTALIGSRLPPDGEALAGAVEVFVSRPRPSQMFRDGFEERMVLYDALR